jgi:hypothetical protein
MSAERLLRGTVKPRHLLVTTAGYCMSALGHKQTFAPQNVMSALPSKADMCGLRAKSGQTRLDDMSYFIDPNRRFGINLVWLNFLNLFAYPV